MFTSLSFILFLFRRNLLSLLTLYIAQNMCVPKLSRNFKDLFSKGSDLGPWKVIPSTWNTLMVEYNVTLTFSPVHLLTNVTIVHATARCVNTLKLHKYKNFIYPLLRYDFKAETWFDFGLIPFLPWADFFSVEEIWFKKKSLKDRALNKYPFPVKLCGDGAHKGLSAGVIGLFGEGRSQWAEEDATWPCSSSLSPTSAQPQAASPLCEPDRVDLEH